MVAQKFKFLILLLVASCLSASEIDSVKIENHLSSCIAFTDMNRDVVSKIPVLSLYSQISRPIAECGCKSALGTYSIFSQLEGYRFYIISGQVSFVESELKYLPLSPEQKLISGKKLVVSFSCSQPS